MVVLGVALAACAGDTDDPAVAVSDPVAVEDDTATSAPPVEDDAQESAQDEPSDEDAAVAEDGPSSVEVSFQGLDLRVTEDDAGWYPCLATDGPGSVSFGVTDDQGNDLSATWTQGLGGTAIVTLADGTTWGATEGEDFEVAEDPDGVVRMLVPLTSADGSSGDMDVRVHC